MSKEQTTLRLARTVADAADAWLKDPLDTHIYERLVQATLTWRAYSQPMLEGTEHAGRRPAPPTHEQDPPQDPSRAPRSVGEVLTASADPRDVLRELAGHRADTKDAQIPGTGNEPSP